MLSDFVPTFNLYEHSYLHLYVPTFILHMLIFIFMTYITHKLIICLRLNLHMSNFINKTNESIIELGMLWVL